MDPDVPSPVDVHESLQKNGLKCCKSEKISDNMPWVVCQLGLMASLFTKASLFASGVF